MSTIKTLIEIHMGNELDYNLPKPNFQWDGDALWHFHDDGHVILTGSKMSEFPIHECVESEPEAKTPPELAGDSVGETVALLDALARLRSA